MKRKWILAIVICGFFSPVLLAQNALVTPFLQDVTQSSAWIAWETDSGEESVVYYGTTPALGDSMAGSFIASTGSARIHHTAIKALSASTRYYYKAKTEDWESDIFDFVTTSLQSDEQNIRIIAMSDMQRDGGNPAIFGNIIQDGILGYVDSIYGPELTDEIQMVVTLPLPMTVQ